MDIHEIMHALHVRFCEEEDNIWCRMSAYDVSQMASQIELEILQYEKNAS